MAGGEDRPFLDDNEARAERAPTVRALHTWVELLDPQLGSKAFFEIGEEL